MIIKSIHIKEGTHERKIIFSNGVNLIYSKKNSRGKTTLMRFLLYSIGYSVPSTKNIKFEKCEVETTISIEKHGDVCLTRVANTIVMNTQHDRYTFVLPEQQNEFHSLLFNISNTDVLNNLLGTFYIDQEKGWTLLNRGIVIGSIHFSVEELIRGLSGKDYSFLVDKEKRLQRELNKYKEMFSVAKYQETIERESGSLAVEKYEEKIDYELEQLYISKRQLKSEIKRLDNAIRNNNQFMQFINDMKLMVKDKDGTTIPITAESIVGYNDNVDFLETKQRIVSEELGSVLREIEAREKNKVKASEQIAFFDNTETLIQAFDKRIASLNIDAVTIDKEIKHIEKELSETRQTITRLTKTNNDVAKSIYESIYNYATELGINEENDLVSSYLFTSNLRVLSGAVFHKTVFAFRLSYLIAVEKYIGIKLPIILDSPSGKEVDRENIEKMMNILKRDFSDHQIIIASIYKYSFDPINIIEIKEHLVDKLI